jgi:CheY-like chemotaxis protein
MAKILLVEDDLMLAQLYKELLTGQGYTVDHAKDGQEGLMMAQNGGYDLILLDVMLPKMMGIDILKELSKNPPIHPNKKVIITTNLAQEQTIEQAKSYGVDTYIVKSNINPQQFLEIVAKNIQSSLTPQPV